MLDAYLALVQGQEAWEDSNCYLSISHSLPAAIHSLLSQPSWGFGVSLSCVGHLMGGRPGSQPLSDGA